jgi:NAD+ synthase
VIPQSSITKAPTAELRPNQTDQDSLPPYDDLDAILHGLIEEEQSVDQIVAAASRAPPYARAAAALLAEYKRRQAPPGVKITRKSFGRDRRYPMTNAFRE